MKKTIKKTGISTLAPLLLFTVFSFCVVAVIMMGAQIYRTHTSRDRNSFDHRTAEQYITTRIRQSDTQGACFIGDFNSTEGDTEGDTFFFCETFGDDTYYTRIYCYNGYLYELFTPASGDFSREDGEKILEMKSLAFRRIDEGISVDLIFSDGTASKLYVGLRCETEVPS
ncbi:MAG: DUF4860 domain-containing protein [Clostridia bacterium]|nr:DUF4860 domain-containing protein [Clostridia bacterium]